MTEIHDFTKTLSRLYMQTDIIPNSQLESVLQFALSAKERCTQALQTTTDETRWPLRHAFHLADCLAAELGDRMARKNNSQIPCHFSAYPVSA